MPRVLVIDDDPSIRMVIRYVLGDEGYEVDQAADGQAALESISRQHPDLILLDMKMPAMDGWEFARHYRAQYGHRAPILVLTAAQDPARRGADVGAEDYLSKPFDLDVLVDRISALLLRQSDEGDDQDGRPCPS